MHPEQPICSAGETCYVDRVVTLTSTRSHRGGARRLTAPGAFGAHDDFLQATEDRNG